MDYLGAGGRKMSDDLIESLREEENDLEDDENGEGIVASSSGIEHEGAPRWGSVTSARFGGGRMRGEGGGGRLEESEEMHMPDPSHGGGGLLSSPAMSMSMSPGTQLPLRLPSSREGTPDLSLLIPEDIHSQSSRVSSMLGNEGGDDGGEMEDGELTGMCSFFYAQYF